MDWINKSRELIRAACTPWGIKASLTAKENYGAIFTRDAVMAGIAGILTEDKVIIKGLKNTLFFLSKLQGNEGQIVSNFRVQDNEITKVSFGTLSPKIDSCTWYLIGMGLMIKKGYIEKEVYLENISKTISLLNGIEYNNKNLMYIPKGGNWADEYIYEGYILYDQILRVWGLSLLGQVYDNAEWSEKASAIQKTLMDSYKESDSKHYHSSFYPGGVFKRFDLAAHAVAGIVMKKNDDFFDQTLDWVADTFLAKDKMPPAFYPAITTEDSDWPVLSQYFLFRFKNMPHHFHNGGIWWIWLGWLAVSLSLWNKEKSLNQLTDLAFKYLNEKEANFEFDEYVSADKLEPNGTKKLVYTASGIIFMSLAKNGFDFSSLTAFGHSTLIESLNIRQEYFNLSRDIVRDLEKNTSIDQNQLVIGIAGESGSGKSVTAKCLQIELERHNISSTIIHQDGYYKLTPKENHEKRKADIGWVGPDELRLDLMQQHIDQFKAQASSIDIPVVNYCENSFNTNTVSLKNKSVLIVEGVYAFFLKNLDFKIFMSRTYIDTLEKRRSRTRETYDSFVEQVLEIEHEIVTKQREQATIFINKDYQVEKPAKHIDQ